MNSSILSKINIKSLLIVAGLSLSSLAGATGTSSYDASSDVKAAEDWTPSSWNVEGTIQAGSVAGAASPWFGFGGSFHLLDCMQLGLRGFIPVSHTVDESTYAFQGFVRVRVANLRHSDFFVEPQLSEDFYNFLPFTSYGFSLGVINHVTPQIGVGLTGGLEFAHAVIDSVGFESRSDTIVYPKVAMIANFGF